MLLFSRTDEPSCVRFSRGFFEFSQYKRAAVQEISTFPLSGSLRGKNRHSLADVRLAVELRVFLVWLRQVVDGQNIVNVYFSLLVLQKRVYLIR